MPNTSSWRVGPVPPISTDTVPASVRLRLAGGIGGDAKKLTGIFVVKLHHHVQQADAGPVGLNNGFRDSTLILEPLSESASPEAAS